MTRPIVPPAPPSPQRPSSELPTPGEPDELAAPRARLPPIPRPPPRLPQLPRGTSGHPPEPAAEDRTPLPEVVTRPGDLPPLYPWLPESPDTAQLPAVDLDLDLASSRLRAPGTPRGSIAPGERIRALVFAPDRTRAAWIDRELSHPPITVQIGRTARNVIAALTRDPPPRPDVLIVDFDAIAPVDLVELHAIRPGGWLGRLIGLGHVPPELCTALGVDHVLAAPLVRDSLLDCVAGTGQNGRR